MFVRVARENHLPFRVSKEWFTKASFMPEVLGPDDIVLDKTISIEPNITAASWTTFYTDALKALDPGVTDMIVHLAYADEEMKAVTFEHPGWGAEWRQRDFDFVTSEEFRKALRDNDIKLITWRELGKLLPRPAPGGND